MSHPHPTFEQLDALVGRTGGTRAGRTARLAGEVSHLAVDEVIVTIAQDPPAVGQLSLSADWEYNP
jgi:hypothetical protein